MDFKRETVIYLEDGMDRYARVVIAEEDGNIYDIVHTYVSDSHRGEGLAAKLVEEAIKYIESRNGKLKVSCSYAVKYVDKHDIPAIGGTGTCSLQHMMED